LPSPALFPAEHHFLNLGDALLNFVTDSPDSVH